MTSLSTIFYIPIQLKCFKVSQNKKKQNIITNSKNSRYNLTIMTLSFHLIKYLLFCNSLTNVISVIIFFQVISISSFYTDIIKIDILCRSFHGHALTKLCTKIYSDVDSLFKLQLNTHSPYSKLETDCQFQSIIIFSIKLLRSVKMSRQQLITKDTDLYRELKTATKWWHIVHSDITHLLCHLKAIRQKTFSLCRIVFTIWLLALDEHLGLYANSIIAIWI